MRLGNGGWQAILGVSLALGLAAGVAAAAVPYTVNSGWQDFFMTMDEPAHGGGWGGSWDDPYTFTLAADGILKVTDAFLAGDSIRVWNGDTWLFDTPAVPIRPDLWTDSPDFAFGDAAWSSTSFALAAGSYSLYFQDLLMADGDPPTDYEVASAYFRVDTEVPPIPEPGTVALLGLGLVAVGVTVRRRMRA